ncbi:extensin family protein [Rhizobium sp. PL01]|uniref:extensin family protein n=1 Tax=Rhizobium sp. PL01 TaxID=3085631 RepID=UPI00298163A6|nr:extensin family protein [Rhizobium sp. PL01]MDW5312813.1 extensin family protein [Rhizobium sp. PL01]
MPLRFLASLLPIILLLGAGLPAEGPLPEKKPEASETVKPAEEKTKEQTLPSGGEAPVPTPSQAETSVANPEAKPGPEAKPEAEVKPEPKPEGEGKPDVKPETEAKPEPVLTIKPEDGKEYIACLADLKAIGAIFKEETRIDDGNGCGIDKPLTLSTVLPGIALKPEGKMRCETALELARWTKDAVLPAAKVALESEGDLTTINQASSYICRLRNNAKTGKISEHARGNAIDIASFTFKNGKSIEIQPRDEDSTLAGAFQRAVTATGCLYFETVLDPGSDEAHEHHLHFDVIERKGGYRYCR